MVILNKLVVVVVLYLVLQSVPTNVNDVARYSEVYSTSIQRGGRRNLFPAKVGSCLLWVMSTEISVDIAVDSRSI